MPIRLGHKRYARYSTFTKTSTPRYGYDAHAMLGAAWGIPLGGSGLSFEGFANFIDGKGKNESGADTAAETNIDRQLMYDVCPVIGAAPKSLKVGVAYPYWQNKFGNNSDKIKGATANTPMVRVGYHF